MPARGLHNGRPPVAAQVMDSWETLLLFVTLLPQPPERVLAGSAFI